MGRLGIVLLLAFASLVACERVGPPAPYEQRITYGAPAPAAAPGPHPDSITVSGGDTLYGLARRYGVPTRAIIDANHLNPPYRLVAGRVLVLPQVRTHQVRAGETLLSVARLYGVDMSTLAATNHLAPPFVIRTGESLVLPAPVEGATAIAVAAPAAAPPQGVTAAPLAAPVAASAPPVASAAPAPPPEPPAAAMTAVTRPLPPVAAPESAPAAPPPPPQAPPKPEETATIAPPPVPIQGKGFLWPVHGTVLSSYGTAADGIHNDGINIAAPAGTPVVAAEAGEVAYAGNELKGYGNLVLIKHPDGYITAYAHLQSMAVKRYDKVARGQQIGSVGATGAVSAPQLHFEIRRGARAVDPAGYLPSAAAARS